jgi:hypothetical protein
MAIKLNSKITLQWRLLGGFLFSAAITGISVFIGIMSLRQIQSNMNISTTNIGTHIDHQNSIISQLMPLRSLVASISTAKNSAELAEKEKDIKILHEVWKDRNNKEQTNIIDDLEKLYQHKHRHLQALRNLFELRKSNVVTLVEVNRIAHNILNDPKFNSESRIADALTRIKAQFDDMFVNTESAFRIVKSSLLLRAYCSELNIMLKDAILSSDAVVVGYAETEISAFLAHIRNEVKNLPNNESILKLTKMIDDSEKITLRLFEKKKEFLLSSKKDAFETELAEFRKEGDALFHDVNRLVMQIADDAQFDSALQMDESAVKMRSDLDQTSATSASAVSIIKAVMSLRYYCNELNAKVKDALAATDAESVDRAKTEISELLANTRKELLELPKDEKILEISETLNTLAPLTEKMFDAVKQVLAANDALNGTSERIRKHLADVDIKVIAVAIDMKSNANRTLEFTKSLVDKWKYLQYLIGFCAVVLAIAVGYFTSKSMNKTIRSITGSMSNSINQVASASGQVSSVNHQLVEGASQQSASIHKTSCAVSNLLALTRKNEDTANRVNVMMKKTSDIVEHSAASMSELTHSIQEISAASNETRKVIRTIDEIAFQTRLLSLNASIEAARAGDAGLGFAVVAEEVRNLAMRSAESAKNTASLIENIIGKIREQSGLVEKTDSHFSQVARSVSDVDELVRDIIAAFNEQGTGIEQISATVSEVEDVIRQNTAHAENSVSVFAELNRHTERMLSYIRILRGLEEQQLFQKYIRIPHTISGKLYFNKSYEEFLTKNMSVGGVLIITEKPIEIGTIGKAEFDISDSHLPLLTAQVIRQTEHPECGKYEVALKFMNISSKTQKILNNVIASFLSPSDDKTCGIRT